MSDDPLNHDALFESQLISAAQTMHAVPGPIGELREHLRFAQQLIAEAGVLSGAANLVFRDRDGRVQVQEIGTDLRVGRAAGCELRFEGLREVSRVHFTIRRLEAGDYWLEDSGSLNGTRIRGRGDRVSRHLLADGDVIEAGGFSFLFLLGLPEGAERAVASGQPSAPPL